MKPSLTNQLGFTIIEIIIGVTILAGMSLLMYGTISRSLEGRTRVEKRDETIHGMRVGLDKMLEDISQAFVAHNDFKGSEGDYESGMKGSAEKIDFSTMGHYHFIADARDTDQVTVGYYLESDGHGYQRLMRREAMHLSDALDEGGTAIQIIEYVRSLKFSYYDANKKEWVDDWDTAGLSGQGKMPRAVKIELEVVEISPEDEDKVVREHQLTTIAKVGLYNTSIAF